MSIFNTGFFSKLFGKDKTVKKTSVVDYFTPYFSSFSSDITTSNAVIESIYSITKHASKMKMTHYQLDEKGKIKEGRAALNYILQYAPNTVENGSDFLEKAMYHWLVDNNLFIYLKFIPSNIFSDTEVLDSMWVLNPYDVKVNIKDGGEIFLTFSINNDQERITTSIENVAVVKRLVGKDEFFGLSNSAITQVLDIINTNYQGIEQSIKASAFIRFIVESVTVLSPEKRIERAASFSNEFLQASQNGGVIFSDATNKITQVSANGTHSNFKEMESFYQAVHNYFGTNEKIISSNYSDAEWNSFFESTLEVFINKLEIELTKKIFTKGERKVGNKIVVEVDKIQNMSIPSRLSIITQLKEMGVMTINEIRNLVYLPPIDGGDKREVSLNYVDADNQNAYQKGDVKPKEEPKNGKPKETADPAQ